MHSLHALQGSFSAKNTSNMAISSIFQEAKQTMMIINPGNGAVKRMCGIRLSNLDRILSVMKSKIGSLNAFQIS